MKRNSKCKRTLAILMSMVMLLTLIQVPYHHVYASESTPENGTWTAASDTDSVSSADGVLSLKKTGTNEKAVFTNNELYSLGVEEVTDFELKWSMKYQSKNSNATIRLNIHLYDADKSAIAYDGATVIYGDRVVLSREDDYSSYEEVYTIQTIPVETAYISYEIVIIGGSADVCVKDITSCKAEKIENPDKSSETGWTAQEVWYPETEDEDGCNQFRYFRIKVDLGDNTLQENSQFRIQLLADDSCQLINPDTDKRVANAIWINEQLAIIDTTHLSDDMNVIKENGKQVLSYAVDTTQYDIAGKSEFYICIRVINVSSTAGLVLQAYGRRETYTGTGEEPNEWEYEKIVETNAQTTLVSKLDCTENLGSGWTSYVETETDWYKYDYTPTEGIVWVNAEERGLPPYGNLGDVPFDWAYSDCQGFYCDDSTIAASEIEASAGEEIVISKTAESRYFTGDVQVELYSEDDAECNIVATLPTTVTWSNQTISFLATLPDYLGDGTYCVRLMQGRCFNGLRDNVIAKVNLTAASKSVVTSEIKSTKNGVRLQINKENVSPILYVIPGENSYYSYDTMSGFSNARVTLYTNFSISLDGINNQNPVWSGEDTINTDILDNAVYRTLDLNDDAMLVVYISMDAPTWWQEANPDELMVGADGKTIAEVSFASEKYREDAEKILEKIIQYLATSPYKHRICGIRLSGGSGGEWLYISGEDGIIGDYSSSMQALFQTLYPDMSFPEADDTSNGSFGVLLDADSQANAIAYQNCLSKAVTDSLITYAKTVKDTLAQEGINWIVGTYGGYIWNGNTAGSIGMTHTTCEEVLDCEYIDFISSPVNYAERISGYGNDYMTAQESIAAHGKLYIAEQDNRTVYSKYSVTNGRTDSLGKTYTVEDTVTQLKRDVTIDLVEGSGAWFYDMQGGWYDNEDIYKAIATIKEEYDNSLSLNTKTNSEVAVFVGSENYDYLANDTLIANCNDSYKVLYQLYASQRMELSRMGTSYDTYMIEDLTDETISVDWSSYKFNIILSPVELTQAEIQAIQEKLEKNGNYVLWVYMPGVSDGTSMSADNMSKAIGMEVSILDGNGAITKSAQITNEAFGNTDTSYGTAYATQNTNAKIPYISDEAVTALAVYDDGKVAAAMKQDEDYTGIYSAVPGVSAATLRTLAKAAGVHIYTEDKDSIIETNASYISIYSQVAGEKTIHVPQGYSVWDVYGETSIELENDVFTTTLVKDEIKLYRLTKEIVNKDYNGGLFSDPTFDKWSEDEPVNASSSGAVLEKVYENTEGGFLQTLVLKDDTTSTDATYVQRAIENMETEKIYEISFDAKFVGTGMPHFSVQERQTSSYEQNMEKYLTSDLASGEWTRITLKFYANCSTNMFRWRILGTPDKTSAFYITNVCVKGSDGTEMITNGDFASTPSSGWIGWSAGADEVSDRGVNLVSNGSFETEKDEERYVADGWYIRSDSNTNATLSDEEKTDGNKSLKLMWNTGESSLEVGMSSYITLKKSTKYIVQFDAKTTDSLVYLEAGLLVKNASGDTTYPTLCSVIRGTDGDWKTFKLEYETDDDLLESRNTLLYFKTGNNPASIYIDNVEIYTAESGTNITNDVSAVQSTVSGISGVSLKNNGVYIQTVTSETREDATYILKCNAAKTGTGKAQLWVNETTDNTVVANKVMNCTTTAASQKYLINPGVAAQCTLRFSVFEDWAGDTTVSVGNVSMKMNRGDFDDDDKVSEDDLRTMRQIVIGDSTTADKAEFGDLTADNEVDVRDLVRMKHYMAGTK